MKIRASRRGAAIVVDVHGHLAVTDDMSPLRSLPESLGAGPGLQVVLNLENVPELDCTGIGELVRLHCAFRQSGAALTLINVAPRQKQMLEIVGLLGVLSVCNSLDHALPRNEGAAPDNSLSLGAAPDGHLNRYAASPGTSL